MTGTRACLTQSYLFIGGSKDGQRYEIPCVQGTAPMSDVTFPVFDEDQSADGCPLASPIYRTETYRRECISVSGVAHYFYKISGMAISQAVQKLFENYSVGQNTKYHAVVERELPNGNRLKHKAQFSSEEAMLKWLNEDE